MITLIKLTSLFTFITILGSCNNSSQNDKSSPIKHTIQNDTIKLKTSNLQREKEFLDYVLNPDSTDKTCISDVKKAKKDIESGKLAIVYTNNEGANMRYEHFMKEICKKYGLSFKIDFIDDVIILDYENAKNQTQGCYQSYMDKVIADSLGVNFKKDLENKADNLYLSALLKDEHPEWYFRCDTKPKPLLNKRKHLKTTITIKDLDLKTNPRGNVWPSVDIGFIIELDGEITQMISENFISQLPHNEKFRDTLYKIGANHIKTNYPVWEPGKIRDTKVRTRNNVKLTFIKE